MAKEVIGLGMHYLDPNRFSYKEYMDLLILFNMALQKTITDNLGERIGKIHDGLSVNTVGSDARLEKGHVSLVELVLVVNHGIDPQPIKDKLDQYVSLECKAKFFERYIETKYIEDDKMVTYIGNRGTEDEFRMLSPNRIIDLVFLYGDNRLTQKALDKLVYELRDSPDGRSILKGVKSKLSNYRKAAISGVQKYKNEDLLHYDLNNGISYYDPNNRLWSFKQGPLRLVQCTLVRDKIRFLRSGGDSKYLLGLPKNTLQVLERLYSEKRTNLPESQVNDVIDNYRYFIWQYHRSQKQYNEKGDKELQFDPKEVRERCLSLAKICENDIIKIEG